jgi:hypothetical protein
MLPRDEEVILPLPSPRSVVPRASKVRGAWLGSSLRGLRERGLLDRYLEHLPLEFHEALRAPAATEWYPIEVANAHYATADTLEISTGDLLDMGRDATRIAHTALIGIAAKLTGETGTPWLVIAQLQRLWERTFIGGAVGATRIGPKEARIEIVQWPCAQYRHCRIALRGVAAAMAELFCPKAYATEVTDLCTPLSLGVRIAWV